MAGGAFKGAGRTPRQIVTEESYGRGMQYTASPLLEGFCKALVNFDFRDAGQMLVPRPGWRTLHSELAANAALPQVLHHHGQAIVRDTTTGVDDTATYILLNPRDDTAEYTDFADGVTLLEDEFSPEFGGQHSFSNIPQKVTQTLGADDVYEIRRKPRGQVQMLHNIPLSDPDRFKSQTFTPIKANLNADKLDGQDGSYYAVSTHTHSGVYQPVDADLTAIAALAGTSGILKKTAADTWALDTSTYLTGNQSISLSGDVSGSGTTAITVTITDDSHNHTGTTISALDAGDVTTGTFDIARIPTGSTGTTVSLGNHTHSYQPLDGDLTAIAALATNGFAKRTGTDTWTIDTTTYAPLNSPTLTGTPAAPTATQGTNTTQIATTAYVQTELSNFSGGQYLGTAATKAIMYNSQSIAENVTIGATQNALSAGPITIADGYTVTINDGGTWTIV